MRKLFGIEFHASGLGRHRLGNPAYPQLVYPGPLPAQPNMSWRHKPTPAVRRWFSPTEKEATL